MHEFSTPDGFVDITECMAEMIKYVANEPSVGLFYVQQHSHNAVPNVVRLRNKIFDKSHETTLHTEDSEDSIATLRSMKECGFPIADEMIRDIRKTLGVMSTKQPRRGLIQQSRSSLLLEGASSWGSSSWGRLGDLGQQDRQQSGYFSSVFKSAKKKASNFKWPPVDSTELLQTRDDKKLWFYPNRSFSASFGASTSSPLQDVEADELPLSCHFTDKAQEKDEDMSSDLSLHNLVPEGENYDKFKEDKEAKLEEWLKGHGGQDGHSQEKL